MKLSRWVFLADWTCVSHAQETRSMIYGRIVDPQNQAISRAIVTVKNLDTGSTSTHTTNETSYYEASLLLPGSYQVSVDAQGFRKFVRNGVTLSVSARGRSRWSAPDRFPDRHGHRHSRGSHSRYKFHVFRPPRSGPANTAGAAFTGRQSDAPGSLGKVNASPGEETMPLSRSPAGRICNSMRSMEGAGAVVHVGALEA